MNGYEEVVLMGGRNNVAFSGDGGLVVAEGADKVWDPRTGRYLPNFVMPKFSGYKNRIAISPNGLHIVSGPQIVNRVTNDNRRLGYKSPVTVHGSKPFVH